MPIRAPLMLGAGGLRKVAEGINRAGTASRSGKTAGTFAHLSQKVADQLGAAGLGTRPTPPSFGRVAGVRFRPVAFTPSFHKYAGEVCHGVQLHVVDRGRFRPFSCGLRILYAAIRQAPDGFRWRTEPYEFSDRPAIDLLTGDIRVRQALEAGQDPVELERGFRDDLAAGAEHRAILGHLRIGLVEHGEAIFHREKRLRVGI